MARLEQEQTHLQFKLNLSRTDYEALRSLAAFRGESMSEVLRAAVGVMAAIESHRHHGQAALEVDTHGEWRLA